MHTASVGTNRAQQQVNARVLLRDGYRCMLHLEGEWTTRTGQTRHCMGTADCVHHTRGVQVTGWDMEHMIASCTPCNLRVGQPDRTHDPAPRPMTTW